MRTTTRSGDWSARWLMKATPGIEDTRKWYANLGNEQLKALEKKYGY